MKKVILLTFIGSVFLMANTTIPSAKKISQISKQSTQNVIQENLKNKQFKKVLNDLEEFTAKKLKEVAKKGFYNLVRIEIIDGDDKKTGFIYKEYKKLNHQQKDILKSIYENNIKKAGYSIQKGKYDILGIDYWIGWK